MQRLSLAVWPVVVQYLNGFRFSDFFLITSVLMLPVLKFSTRRNEGSLMQQILQHSSLKF